MDQILIVGIDSPCGRSLAKHLSESFEVHGLWFRTPVFTEHCSTAPLDESTLTEFAQNCDKLIFCGNAARSSWENDFGRFEYENKWLSPCIQVLRNHPSQLVFLSSDAVFDGPWLFHGDNSSCYSSTSVSRRLRDFEQAATTLTDSVIVRTHIVSQQNSPSCFADKLNALEQQQIVVADSSIHATPISENAFSETLAACLKRGVTGYLNIGGAERTTQHSLLCRLATEFGLNHQSIHPEHNPQQKLTERSLRCDRVRQQFDLTSPLLTQTIDALCDSLYDLRSTTGIAA